MFPKEAFVTRYHLMVHVVGQSSKRPKQNYRVTTTWFVGRGTPSLVSIEPKQQYAQGVFQRGRFIVVFSYGSNEPKSILDISSIL